MRIVNIFPDKLAKEQGMLEDIAKLGPLVSNTGGSIISTYEVVHYWYASQEGSQEGEVVLFVRLSSYLDYLVVNGEISDYKSVDILKTTAYAKSRGAIVIFK